MLAVSTGVVIIIMGLVQWVAPMVIGLILAETDIMSTVSTLVVIIIMGLVPMSGSYGYWSDKGDDNYLGSEYINLL